MYTTTKEKQKMKKTWVFFIKEFDIMEGVNEWPGRNMSALAETGLPVLGCMKSPLWSACMRGPSVISYLGITPPCPVQGGGHKRAPVPKTKMNAPFFIYIYIIVFKMNEWHVRFHLILEWIFKTVISLHVKVLTCFLFNKKDYLLLFTTDSLLNYNLFNN